MSARVLVVDDLLPNVRLLEARLSAEYFDVSAAMSGADALALCEQNLCDIVLLDAMMPGMDGFEVCRRLKSSPATAHIPVVMVTALDQPSDRLRGLDAGADDFLTKPVDDTALLARVRSLVRLKATTDELRARVIASREYGMDDPLAAAAAETGHNARVLLVDDRASSYERMAEALSPFQRVDIEADPQAALIRAAEQVYDVILVSLDLKTFDGLRLCSQLRALDRTRNSAILMIADADAKVKVLRGLDIGVHDFLVRPVDRNELVARVRTQVRRKRFADRLRDSVHASMELAVTDPLTGLHNRRYLDTHLVALFDEAALQGAAAVDPGSRHRSFQGHQRRLWPRRRRRGAEGIRGAHPRQCPRHRRGVPCRRRGGGRGRARYASRRRPGRRRAHPAACRGRALRGARDEAHRGDGVDRRCGAAGRRHDGR